MQRATRNPNVVKRNLACGQLPFHSGPGLVVALARGARHHPGVDQVRVVLGRVHLGGILDIVSLLERP